MGHTITRRRALTAMLGLLGAFTLSACSDDHEPAARPHMKADASRPTLTMGIFPRRNLAATRKAFRPLSRHLSKELNTNVKLVVPTNFKEFWNGVTAKEFDLVHFNQYHYVSSHKTFGYQVILTNEEFGSKEIAGALFVRKDSGIKSVADLKGKRILFGGGKKAMGSYIAPMAVLKESGLEPGKDFAVEFSKNPPAALINVHRKIFDAAGAGDVVIDLKGVREKIDTSQMTILAKGQTFTHLPWAVKEDTAPALVERLQKLMTGLSETEEGRKILKAAQVTAFHPATDKDFDKVREIVQFALGEQY